MGIDEIHILYDPDEPIAESRELTEDELRVIRAQHERNMHDRNKLVCCPQCFPKS